MAGIRVIRMTRISHPRSDTSLAGCASPFPGSTRRQEDNNVRDMHYLKEFAFMIQKRVSLGGQGVT